MIVIRLKGGLGNQLFQYAFGYTLSKRFDDALYVDTEWFETEGKVPWLAPRKYELSPFEIPSAKHIKHKELPITVRFIGHRFLRRAFGKLGKCTIRLGVWISVSTTGNRDYMQLKKHPNIYLNGYFDNDAAIYLQPFSAEIQNEFRIRNVSKAARKRIEQIKKGRSTAVHVRRTDQMHSTGHKAGIDYYKKAIAQINECVSDTTFYFFSDDIEWCKSTFSEYKNVVFVENDDQSDAMSDFVCMMNCDNNVIAYSTYSWWAAYLNPNPDKIVIMPEFYDNSGLTPDNWIVVRGED